MFYIYVLFLILSGIAMLVMAGVRSGQAKSRRVWNGLFGAGFTIYGLYLLLFFQGGHYVLFYYAFILPVLMIVRFFRDRSAFRARQAAAAQAPVPGYGQPGGYGQPMAPPAGYAQPMAPPAGYAQPMAPPAGYAQPMGQPAYGQPPAGGQPGEGQTREGQPGGYGQPGAEHPQGPAR